MACDDAHHPSLVLNRKQIDLQWTKTAQGQRLLSKQQHWLRYAPSYVHQQAHNACHYSTTEQNCNPTMLADMIHRSCYLCFKSLAKTACANKHPSPTVHSKMHGAIMAVRLKSSCNSTNICNQHPSISTTHLFLQHQLCSIRHQGTWLH